VWGLFFDGELVGYGFNQSLGVDGLVCIFTQCDYQTNHGDILAECIDWHSLMNYFLVTALGNGYLDYSTTTFFLFIS
jgi:hypothetical protein